MELGLGDVLPSLVLRSTWSCIVRFPLWPGSGPPESRGCVLHAFVSPATPARGPEYRSCSPVGTDAERAVPGSPLLLGWTSWALRALGFVAPGAPSLGSSVQRELGLGKTLGKPCPSSTYQIRVCVYVWRGGDRPPVNPPGLSYHHTSFWVWKCATHRSMIQPKHNFLQ